MINLDYASHTPVCETVLAHMCQVAREYQGNVMAAHSAGRKARAEMDRITSGIGAVIGAKASEIIFVSGASEANNLAIKGIANAYSHVGKHILSTCLEHPSVSGTLNTLIPQGYEVELLKILPSGHIDLQHLKAAIRPSTVLVCVSGVDSELGAIQPLEAIGEIVAQHPHCHLHVDAAQAVGKIPSAFVGSTFAFSPHKFHGPCGIGVLVKREGVVLEPLIHGGASTTIYRSGTPTLMLTAGAHMALDVAVKALPQRLSVVRQLNEAILAGVANIPHMWVNSPLVDGSPYILNLGIRNMRGIQVQEALDRLGIWVSVKSACSTDNAPSRPVMAVTGDKKRALSSFRVSLSHETTPQDVAQLLAALSAIAQQHQ